MHSVTCRGLQAAWLNGWLAAVGATVLDDRLRLHWTEDGAPVAVLSADEVDPVEAVVASWPDEGMLADLPIAEDWKGAGRLRRKVSVDDFDERARAARGDPHSWALSSTMTDLSVDENGEVAHAPLDPPAPKGIWLHARLLNVHKKVTPSVDYIRDSLAGLTDRIQANGLGFDQSRLGSLSDGTRRRVHPVIETLAFFGFALYPVRGAGVDRRLSRSVAAGGLQRGWSKANDQPGGMLLRWPAWSPSLDNASIDALLDVWRHDKQKTWLQYGIHAAWRSVPFKPTGSADTTRAYGSERL